MPICLISQGVLQPGAESGTICLVAVVCAFAAFNCVIDGRSYGTEGPLEIVREGGFILLHHAQMADITLLPCLSGHWHFNGTADRLSFLTSRRENEQLRSEMQN